MIKVAVVQSQNTIDPWNDPPNARLQPFHEMLPDLGLTQSTQARNFLILLKGNVR